MRQLWDVPYVQCDVRSNGTDNDITIDKLREFERE